MLDTARQILRHRALLGTLTRRELAARYRGSLLGFFWSLVQPLLLLAVYTFVFSVVFAPRVAGAEPYPLFLVCGLFPWIWLATSLTEGTVALAANAPLLKRAVFPAELLPMVPVLANLVHLLFALPVLTVALVVGRLLGYPVGGAPVLLLPAVLALELPALGGAALGLAALQAHFKDVRDLLASALTLFFFLTPVLYPLSAIPIPALTWIVRANPATPFTLAYQQLLFAGEVPSPGLWLQMVLVSAVAWIVGAGLFSRLRDTLVEAV